MQVVNYLVVFLCVKHALVKIVLHIEAFERAARFKADNLVCMQPSSSKDGEALHKFV